ncbi:MAG: undecaprenyl/decaprenyl-phosphate alpha-N-acetylglucosaminyl 1-phosphate transferase [Defluviitaleaceae bacterium]|nr:undecaprenyl/decaprenyl-phosphate alpha-N-acetylglucosaminyl 1-phosphate transferase [Defluviitaleaceae bacterium]
MIYGYDIEHNWLLYVAVFATAFAVTLLLTPWAKKVAVKVGAVDAPKDRGLHKKTMPRMGGLAMFIGFMTAMIVAAFVVEDFRSLEFAGFVVGGVIIAGLGVLDDIYHLRAYIKLVVQIAVALIVVFTGTQIEFIHWPVPEFLGNFSIPITVLWVVGIINAVNFVDGVDGLAAGVSSIAAIFLTILCIMTGSPLAVVFAITLAGSCLGFLPRNFSPAEIFMGDTGSTFLGYVLAVSSIMGVYKSYALLSVVIAGFALALPIMDTVYVTVCRILKRKNPMKADRGHFHHKLIDRGWSHRKTVITLYSGSILAGVVAVLIALEDGRALIIGGVSLLVIFSIIYVYRKRLSLRNTEENQQLGQGTDKKNP